MTSFMLRVDWSRGTESRAVSSISTRLEPGDRAPKILQHVASPSTPIESTSKYSSLILGESRLGLAVGRNGSDVRDGSIMT